VSGVEDNPHAIARASACCSQLLPPIPIVDHKANKGFLKSLISVSSSGKDFMNEVFQASPNRIPT